MSLSQYPVSSYVCAVDAINIEVWQVADLIEANFVLSQFKELKGFVSKLTLMPNSPIVSPIKLLLFMVIRMLSMYKYSVAYLGGLGGL